MAASAARLVLPSRKSVPSLYVAHGLHVTSDSARHKSAAFGAVEHSLVGRTNAIALVAREDFELARRLRWGRRSLIWRLPGAGVDIAKFSDASATSMQEGGPRTALFCGELNANKGFGFCLEVAAELVRRGLIDRFLVVGDGPLRTEAERASTQPWCEYVPFSSQMPHVMASAHLLLHASAREGLPRVIIEAMASGVPVLARSNRGSRELVTREVGAVLSGPPRVADWVAAARTLLGEWDGRPAQARATRYSTEAFSASYGELLDAIDRGCTSGYRDGGGA